MLNMTQESKMNEQSTNGAYWIWICIFLLNLGSCADQYRMSKIEKRLESLEATKPVEKKNE